MFGMRLVPANAPRLDRWGAPVQVTLRGRVSGATLTVNAGQELRHTFWTTARARAREAARYRPPLDGTMDRLHARRLLSPALEDGLRLRLSFEAFPRWPTRGAPIHLGRLAVMDVTEDPIEIRAFEEGDLEAVVEFSLRAWEPVFTSVRSVLGDEVFLRLHPEWQESQAEAVRSSCTNPDRDVFVAVVDDRPVAFVAVALNAFHERMGWIDIIGVDPDYQRRGISSQLTELAIDHMRSHGMDIAVVETGGDPGHAPARAAYEAAGFTLLPVARYFRLLD